MFQDRAIQQDMHLNSCHPMPFLKSLYGCLNHNLQYLQELSADITDMIRDASADEKNILRQKMTTLASKIQ